MRREKEEGTDCMDSVFLQSNRALVAPQEGGEIEDNERSEVEIGSAETTESTLLIRNS
jgi:hypothetical protein